MRFEQKNCYHVYNQGNNRRRIFLTDENYLFFLRKMGKHLKPFCNIMAYCLMPNHFHWLIYIKDHHSFNRKIGTILSSYTQALNKQTSRSGSLFRQRTKAVHLNSLAYAQTCLHYIHQNPVRAGLVTKMEHWPYSSFRDYAGIRDGTLPSTAFSFSYLAIDRNLFAEESKQFLDSVLIEKLH